ncbi:MAG: class I SAM-dependent methyltransferase [Treponema sp.]|jgi:23S rRNA G2069 N7-methylase RlmK/C1962 C5-methylase RlmI|nr:class I SAM-dependent methyltransferase [Treponema sp.]
MEEIPGQGKTAAQAEMLANRLRKRYGHLKKWARRTGTDAFRLYDRDIPEIPLVLDLYGDALSGALYRRPGRKPGENGGHEEDGGHEENEDEERRWLLAMKEAAALALNIDPRHVFIKIRERQRGKAQYERFAHAAFEREIHEGDLAFRVNLSDYLDTGLFLDRRALRAMIRGKAAGKRVLNLFSYTGSFSVCAARGGAAETDSVDLSNTYLRRAADNFRLNGFAAVFENNPFDMKGANMKNASFPHRLIRADALLFSRIAAAAGRRWDLVILDPPAFSNSKKMKTSLDIKRDHRELVAQSLALLERGGSLLFSTGAKGFTLDRDYFSSRSGFPGLEIRDLGNLVSGEDFRGKKAPACYLFSLDGFQKTDSST